jgi:hypothetical protein
MFPRDRIMAGVLRLFFAMLKDVFVVFAAMG